MVFKGARNCHHLEKMLNKETVSSPLPNACLIHSLSLHTERIKFWCCNLRLHRQEVANYVYEAISFNGHSLTTRIYKSARTYEPPVNKTQKKLRADTFLVYETWITGSLPENSYYFLFEGMELWIKLSTSESNNKRCVSGCKYLQVPNV